MDCVSVSQMANSLLAGMLLSKFLLAVVGLNFCPAQG